jgi:hypothetical protein
MDAFLAKDVDTAGSGLRVVGSDCEERLDRIVGEDRDLRIETDFRYLRWVRRSVLVMGGEGTSSRMKRSDWSEGPVKSLCTPACLERKKSMAVQPERWRSSVDGVSVVVGG